MATADEIALTRSYEMLRASADNLTNPPLVHMWEWEAKTADARSMNIREEEEAVPVFSVMGRDKMALYDDIGSMETALPPIRHRRLRCDDKEGFVALSTGVLSSKVRFRLFNMYSQTGVILHGAPIIFALQEDAYTKYAQKGEPVSAQYSTNIMHHPFPPQGLLGAQVPEKLFSELAPFLSPEQLIKIHRNYALSLNPFSDETKRNGQAMLEYMMAKAQDDPERSLWMPEVVANAGLEHAKGIVVDGRTKGDRPLFTKQPENITAWGEELTRVLTLSREQDPERFLQISNAAVGLYRGLIECNILAQAKAKYGVTGAPPTVVLYQQMNESAPLMHFPAMPEAMQMLEEHAMLREA